jgi:SOS-response transcriptional repressor LexA/DNA-binding XRE family transcriptional regulator
MIKNYGVPDFKTRLKNLREVLDQTQAELAVKMGIARTSLANYESGTSIPPGDFIYGLNLLFNVNIDWFLTGEGEMFLGPKREEKHPLVASLEAMMDQRLEKIEAKIAEIEGQLKGKGEDGPNFGMFTSEPEPEYGDDSVKAPFVDNIAAGPPIQQSEDLSEFIDVPGRFIKTKPEDYYAARIRGESMTAAGIPDGCTVLIRRSDVPRDGAIQVVRCGGKSTLKRMREGEDHTWTLHYEDNSERLIPIGKDEEYQVQGDFVAVLPERG